ncbi:MAG: hypothetical protein AAB554_04965 [Patescibacteria group bacterium]
MNNDVTACEWIRSELARQSDALRTAVDELNGEKEPEKPAELVNRIRCARKEIRALLDEAGRLGMRDPIVMRLRAAHPARPAK